MRKNQKGFTLVELLVVIAILAILATVAVVGYSSFIDSAKESNDKTLVGQMNTFLQANEMLDYDTIVDLYEGLAENGITADDYQTRVEGRFFFWDKKLNRVLYTDEEYNVIFPAEYKDVKHTEHQWYSLSGAINEEKVENVDGVVTIQSAEEFYYLANHLDEIITGASTTINLPAKLDVMGADITLVFKNKGTVSIVGEEKGTTITGLVQLTHNWVNEKETADGYGKKYNCGLVARVEDTDLTIKDITISESTIGNLEIGSVGTFIGEIHGCNVSLENCSVINSTIYGKNKVAALVGQTNSGVTIKDCTVDSVTVYCSEGESGFAIGCAYNGGTVTIDRAFSGWVTNSTLSLVESNGRNTETVENKSYILVDELSKNFEKQENKYRLFMSDVYMTVQFSGNNKVTVKINDADGNYSERAEEITGKNFNLLDFYK